VLIFIDKTKQEIVKREELLCDLVTTQTQTMTIDLDDELKQKLGTITKLKEKTQNRRQKIGKSIMKIDTLLQSYLWFLVYIRSIPKLKMLDVSMDLISLVMPNNLSTFNLLVSQWNDSKIMCKSHDTCRTLIELPFGDIVGIHASRHNDIFIGMVVELGIQRIYGFNLTIFCQNHYSPGITRSKIYDTNIAIHIRCNICSLR
jgi:hypothetical protein